MARADYFAIEQAIKTLIEGNANTPANTKVFIESEISFAHEACPGVYIYLDRRSAPAGIQRLAAGTRTDFEVRFTVWCAEWHQDSVAKASEFRDDLIGKIELALMSDRTLGGSVESSWLDGGEFGSFEENGFLSLGEIVLIAHVKATA